MRETIHGMIKSEDPTQTDEMAHIEMLAACRPWRMVPPAFFWYYHCGYRDIWNKQAWGDTSMKRSFDEYFEEALDKGWFKGTVQPAPTQEPRVIFEVGSNLLRRTRGGQNMLIKHLWPKLSCIVSVDWRNCRHVLRLLLPWRTTTKLAFMFPAPQTMNLTSATRR
jgi:hypothetical protein